MNDEQAVIGLRWQVVKLPDESRHPTAVKLQMGVGKPGGAPHYVSWEDIPVVDEYGDPIDTKLHMPMWKMD